MAFGRTVLGWAFWPKASLGPLFPQAYQEKNGMTMSEFYADPSCRELMLEKAKEDKLNLEEFHQSTGKEVCSRAVCLPPACLPHVTLTRAGPATRCSGRCVTV